MRLLILYLYLILIIFVNTKTNEIHEKNNQVKNENKSQNVYKESQLKILNDFKPLFGLRKQNNDGQVRNSEITKDLELINKTRKEGVGIGMENEQLIFIWDESMGDFQPEVMLTFELPSGYTEIFFEEIFKPTNIKGAFFISQMQLEERIDFYIKSENNTMIYSKEKVIEAIFNIDILEKGELKFIFQNKRTKGTQTITFTLDVHDSEQELLKMEDLDPLAQKIERISMAMNDNYYFDKVTGQILEGNLIAIQNSNEKLLIYSIIEIFGVILITLFQVFYLKRLANNQRLL